MSTSPETEPVNTLLETHYFQLPAHPTTRTHHEYTSKKVCIHQLSQIRTSKVTCGTTIKS